jgi:uncharacterized protein (DUF1778 family)
MPTVLPIRLPLKDKRLLQQAARAAGLSLSEFVRRAAREKALPATKQAACLSYTDRLQVSADASSDHKAFVRRQIHDKHHR